jgi:hypothetical protein
VKRDPRLQRLSSDHHQGLVLARRVERAVVEGNASAELLAGVRAALAGELEGHFAVEEDVLAPALRAVGLGELATRIERDHAELRRLAREADADGDAAGDAARAALGAFARLLRDHIRWEERELFVTCESALTAEVLAEAARRSEVRPDGGGG